MKKVSVIFSSHFTDEENQKFIDHLKSTAGVQIHVECIKNMRQYSLTEAYNLGWTKLDELDLGKEIIVFCHNDIKILTKDWAKRLIGTFNAFSDFDIIGIAGSDQILEHGVWYLDKNGQLYPRDTHMFGRVWHTHGFRNEESVYSTKINGVKDVVVVDGLFFAVNGSTIVKRFNENFKGFHYYDVSFSFENYLEGCNVGVIDKISVVHQSVGRTNQEWEANRKQFVSLYSEELPISVE